MAKGRTKQSVSEKKSLVCQESMVSEGVSVSGESRGFVVMDRRRQGERRSGQDRRTRQEPVLIERRQLQRRAKVPRRRQIDPTTCERDYTADEIEFMRALDEYKRSSGRMFPTCSEILEVLRKLGYEKRSAGTLAPTPQGNPNPSTGAESPTATPTPSVEQKQMEAS